MNRSQSDKRLGSHKRMLIDPMLSVCAEVRSHQRQSLFSRDFALNARRCVASDVRTTMGSQDQKRHAVVARYVFHLDRLGVARQPERLLLTPIPDH